MSVEIIAERAPVREGGKVQRLGYRVELGDSSPQRNRREWAQEFVEVLALERSRRNPSPRCSRIALPPDEGDYPLSGGSLRSWWRLFHG